MNNCKIYVGNLAWVTNEGDLRESFSNFGTITDAVVMKEQSTGRSRGFGFITFSTQEEAERAIAEMNNVELENRRLRVNFANTRSNNSFGNPHSFGGNSMYSPASGGFDPTTYGQPGNFAGGFPPQGYAQPPTGGANYPGQQPGYASTYSQPGFGNFAQQPGSMPPQFPAGAGGGFNGNSASFPPPGGYSGAPY